MAQTSKRKQQLRRAKRRATLAERYAEFMTTTAPRLKAEHERIQDENTKLKVMLFAILAQGGPREVTQGTIQQVSETFPRLSVTSVPKEDEPTTFTLTLVEALKSEEPTAEPPVERPRLDPLDGMKAEPIEAVQSGAEDIGYDQLLPPTSV